MATMTFLANFDGNLNYQNSAGTGTLSTVGTITYGSSTYFSGKQGLTSIAGMGVSASAAVLANAIDEAAGAIAVRFKRSTDPANLVYLFSAGKSTTGQFIGFRVAANDKLEMLSINGTSNTLSTANTIGTGADAFAYAEWSGTATKVQLDSGTAVTGTRAAAGTFDAAGAMGLGCRAETVGAGADQLSGLVDSIAIFDGPLTTGEVTFLRTKTTPWTWGMVLSNDAPAVNAGSDSTAVTGAAWSATASFTDADSTSWTATVDYDEGAGPVSATVDGGAKTVALSHTWATAGTYNVVVTVTDDGSVSGSDTVQVVVSEAPVVGQYLISTVIGSDGSAPVVTLT